MSAEHVLIRDDDGHWYVCPADRERDAAAAFQAVEDFWRGDDCDADPPPLPDYLREVGGSPTRVKFRDFRIE